MADRRDPIEVRVRGAGEPLTFGDQASCVQLGVSDRPTEVRVRVFRSERRITLDFLYPAGMREERTSVVANRVECFVGAYSGRLLGLAVAWDRSGDVAAQAKQITRELDDALRALKTRSESVENIGTRMNREAVARDFSLTSSIPPPWMMAALEEARRAARVPTR